MDSTPNVFLPIDRGWIQPIEPTEPGQPARPTRRSPAASATVPVALTINDVPVRLDLDPRVTLLDALRERLQLTGTKKGCDHGQCGACTVIRDGRRTLSCLTLLASCDGSHVKTIEGVAEGDRLHPLQEAFIRHDAFQCGYCTPGQMCSMIGLAAEAKNGDVSFVTADVRQAQTQQPLSKLQIKERLSGNICRCGAYVHLIAAFDEWQRSAAAPSPATGDPQA